MKVDPVTAALQKAFGKKAITTLEQGGLSFVREVIPTGFDVLDHEVFGVGGIPVGRIVEVSGGEGSGKSTLGLQIVAAAQREGANSHLLDNEVNAETPRAQALGVDPSKVILGDEVETLEDVYKYLHVVSSVVRAKSDKPTLILWDSLAATPLAAEVEAWRAKKKAGTGEGDDADDETRIKEFWGVRSRYLGNLFRGISKKLPRSRTSFVVVNQLRTLMNVKFGDPNTTPGGKALKHHASIRIRLTGVGKWKVKDKSVGQFVRVVAEKCRWTSPWKAVTLRMHYDTGFDNAWSVIELAIKRGIFKPEGRGNVLTPKGKKLNMRGDEEKLVRIARRYLWPGAFQKSEK